VSGHDFLTLVRGQAQADLRALPDRLRARVTGTGALDRCLNVADVRSLARRRLPRGVFDFVDGAANNEITSNRNQADLARYSLVPRVLRGPGQVDLATTVFGQQLAAPIVGSPTGGTGVVHTAAEAAVAAALNSAGLGYTLSTAATSTAGEVAAAAPGVRFFQLYLGPDRGVTRRVIERARELDYKALVVTVDTPGVGLRERDVRSGFMARRVTARTLLDGMLHPRWTARMLAEPHVFSAGVLSEAAGRARSITNAGLISAQFDPAMVWDDIAWVQEHWDGPVALKGVLHPQDAVQAERLGLAGVVVSNHGGRQLDRAPSAVAALPGIVDVVGSGFEVLLDGGVRRGADVVTALALGARAVLAGRPFVYGLGAGGAAGVRRVADILLAELRLTLTLMGVHSVRDLDPSWLQVTEVPDLLPAARHASV